MLFFSSKMDVFCDVTGCFLDGWVTVKKNCVTLLTPYSISVFIAISDGTFRFSLHGSFKSHQHKALRLAAEIVSTNQIMVE